MYATSYVATRVTLEAVPPATLALIRVVIGAAVLLPLTRAEPAGPPPTRTDRWAIWWMGALGFAAAFALSHWGIARSTATNAALLIVVEPAALLLLGPALLGERLSRREVAGAATALVGTLLVVVNGVPGVTRTLVPHWRGDLLLVLAGLAYASYSLFGRRVLLRRPPLGVTCQSILWGAVALAPLTLVEWVRGLRPEWTVSSVAGTLYLGIVITALGYLAWNWALARVEASRASVFLCVQPAAGALLGVTLLGERLTAFTVVGGGLTVAGMLVMFGRGSR